MVSDLDSHIGFKMYWKDGKVTDEDFKFIENYEKGMKKMDELEKKEIENREIEKKVELEELKIKTKEAKVDKSRETLKKLIAKGFSEGKNINEIFEENFDKNKKENLKIKSKMYRLADTIKKGEKKQKEKKPMAEPFQPTFEPKEVKMEELKEEVKPEVKVEQPILVSEQEAKYISYHLPNSIAKMIDSRIELNPELEKDGAVLFRDVLNNHPSQVNKYLEVIAMIVYTIRVVADIVIQKINLNKEDQIEKNVKNTEGKIKKEIEAHGGFKEGTTLEQPELELEDNL